MTPHLVPWIKETCKSILTYSFGFWHIMSTLR